MKYRAFISYSHAADGQLAPAIQFGLHKFAKPWYRLRAIRVFRDKTGLAITPELWTSIEGALAESEYFVLLASPESAQSKWVAEEVDWWLRHRSPAHLLIVCTNGRLPWEAPGATGANESTAFSAVLQNALPTEPLFLDLRWARTETDLSLRNPRFAEAIARLAATLSNKSLDEMIGADVAQHNKTIRLLRMAIAALLVLTGSVFYAAFLSVRANKVATSTAKTLLADARLRLDEITSRQLATASMNVLAGDGDLAILLAAEAVGLKPTTEAEIALRSALAGPMAPKLEIPDHHDSEDRAIFSPDGTRILVFGDESARLCDPVTGVTLRRLQGYTNRIDDAGFNPSGSQVYAVFDSSSVHIWDAASGRSVVEVQQPEALQAVISPDEKHMICLTRDNRMAVIWELASQTKVAQFDYTFTDFSFSPDGKQVALCSFATGQRDSNYIIALDTGEVLFSWKRSETLEFSPDGTWLLSADFDGAVRRWRPKRANPDRPWVDKNTAELIFQGNTKISMAVLTPDATQIIARDEDQIFHILQTSTGNEVSTIKIFPKPEANVMFQLSPSGKFLLTARRVFPVESFVRPSAELWELKTGRHLAELTADAGRIRSLSFSPDGKRCVIGGFDAPARVYDLEICGSADDLLALAKRRVPRQLTASERQKYLPVTTR